MWIPCKALQNFSSTMSILDMITLRNIYSIKRAGPDSLCITHAPFFHYINSTTMIAVRYECQPTQFKRSRCIDVESMLSIISLTKVARARF